MAVNLRQMMKNKEAERATKITHALARYNNLDQLVCKLCNQVIKSEALWQAHLLSKRHKELLDELKAGKLAKPAAKPSAPPPPTAEPLPPPPVAERKRKEPEPSNAAANNLGEESTNGTEQVQQKRTTSEGGSRLPEGFFDDPKAQQVVEDELTKAALSRLAESRAPSTAAAPHATPIVNPVDAMVAEFEKDIQAVLPTAAAPPPAENMPAPAEEDDDDINIDSEAQKLLDEQEEQKKKFEEVRRRAMEKLKGPSAAKETAKEKAQEEEDDEDLDDEELDGLLLDWRAKNV